MSFISSNQIQFGTASNLGFALNSTVQVNNLAGYNTVSFYLTIPTGATVAFQGAPDGTTFVAANMINSSDAIVTTATTSGWFRGDISAFQIFQVIVTVAGTVAGSVIGLQSFNELGALYKEIQENANLATIVTNTGVSATDFTSSGTISALNGTVSITGQGVYTISASITGTWSGTLVAEGQLADNTWVQVPMYTVNTTLPYASTFTLTSNSTVLITGGGYLNVRIRASAFTSGTVSVALDGSLAQQTVFSAQLGTWNMSGSSTSVSGTISGNGNIIATGSLNNYAGAIVAISGTWSANITVQGSNDGTNYFLVNVTPLGNPNSNQTLVTSNGLYYVPIAFLNMEVVVSGYVSGTISCVTTFHAIPPSLATPTSTVSTFDLSNASALGTLEVGPLTPVLQGDFVYGINTQLWNTATTSGTGATVTTSSNRLNIQCGTGAAGYAYITTKKNVRYRAGQGTTVRFTPLFTTGVANNIQLWGMGTISANLPYDGYFFGYNGTSFGIVRYSAGTATWTPQSSWNQNYVDGTVGTAFQWNPTFGTPVMIKYGYLGYGDVQFYVQNPSTSRWVLVHIIQYANTSATTEVTNPTFQFLGFTLNSGNTTNLNMYCGSFGCFISGDRSFSSNPKWAIDNSKTTITTETCLINLQNCTSYNGLTNRGLIRLNSISFASNTTGIAVLKIRIGATIGGTPAYTAINGTLSGGGATLTAANSVASYDTAGTTATGGTYVFNMTIAGVGSNVIDLTPYFILLNPGDIASITGTSSASATLGVSVNWSEDI